jgi:chromosome segregation protein
VRPRPGFEDSARSLLAGVQLVDSLREVIDVYGGGRIPATFVTPAGDLLTPGGTVSGGTRASGLLSQAREVRDLEQEARDLDERVAATEAADAAAERDARTAVDELENARNRHHTAALAVANHEKDLERTRERVKALGEVQETRSLERSEILSELAAIGQDRERLVTNLDGLRSSRGEKQRGLDALGLRIGSQSREVTRLETTATERRVAHAGREETGERLRRTRDSLLAAATETGEWIAVREEEIRSAEARRVELAGAIEENGTKLARALEREEQARTINDQKREAYERVGSELSAIDEAARSLRGDVGSRRDAVNKAELKVGESELRVNHLDESIREKWDVDLATWTPPSIDDLNGDEAAAATEAVVDAEDDEIDAGQAEGDGEDDGEIHGGDAAKEARANARLIALPTAERRAKLEEIRKKLQAMGDVNLGAIDEHEELRERFRFLSEQKADLETTLSSLRDAIQRINRTSRKRFRETFEEVRKRFSENFPRLFRGGKASLSLTDSEDVLEAGIEIMAMPPGKRLQNVNLLSGGEKTLTAIALLVAVFQVRPSPFFLLDEVDAALDDANIGRFNEIVVEMASDSQFVLITHNKRTIEMADVLYGVTMERKGVSKLVSVELRE